MKYVKKVKGLPLPNHHQKLPFISIIIAARNEANQIEPALQSILNLDYPFLDIVVVNDRSTDSTGLILEKMATQNPLLRVIHIQNLPTGWIGKNHAMYTGALHAKGEFLLFTDADIIYSKELLLKTVYFTVRQRLDFVSILPELKSEFLLAQSFILVFSILLALRQKFWWVHTSNQSAYVGVGAFNLIRKSVYNQFNGHAALPLEVADDMVLALNAKKAGAKSALLSGLDTLSVEWQKGGVDTHIKGMEKNAFAGFNYSWVKVTGGLLLLFFYCLLPYLLMFFSPIGLITLIPITIILANHYRHFLKFNPIHFIFGFPIGALLLMITILNSAIRITIKREVAWRDTVYDMKRLKKVSQFK